VYLIPGYRSHRCGEVIKDVILWEISLPILLLASRATTPLEMLHDPAVHRPSLLLLKSVAFANLDILPR